MVPQGHGHGNNDIKYIRAITMEIMTYNTSNNKMHKNS